MDKIQNRANFLALHRNQKIIPLEVVSLHTLTQYDFIGIQAQVFDDFIGDPHERIADNSALVLWICHVTQ